MNAVHDGEMGADSCDVPGPDNRLKDTEAARERDNGARMKIQIMRLGDYCKSYRCDDLLTIPREATRTP